MCPSKQKLSIVTNIVKLLQQNLMKEVPKHHVHTIIPTVSTMSLNFLENFWGFLKANNQNNDFMSLALGLMENQINKDNIAWLSALHKGRYSNCTTTCSTKYDSQYVEFFSLFYILFRASALNVL